MHFKNAGDVEHGHKHNYDHGTLLSSGTLLVEILNPDSNTQVSHKIVQAPNFVFISKDKLHRLTALAENTVCACIHALRTNDGELLDPDFLVEQLDSDSGLIPTTIMSKTKKQWQPPAVF